MLHNASRSPLALLNGVAVAASRSKPVRRLDGSNLFRVKGITLPGNIDRLHAMFCVGHVTENRQGRPRRAKRPTARRCASASGIASAIRESATLWGAQVAENRQGRIGTQTPNGDHFDQNSASFPVRKRIFLAKAGGLAPLRLKSVAKVIAIGLTPCRLPVQY